jgi:CRISPR/Cas system-associated endoribonuclease Cas2
LRGREDGASAAGEDCQAYGDRVQYSVFLVDTKPAKLLRLRTAIRRIIDPVTDSVLICSLGPLSDRGRRQIEFLGRQRDVTGHDALIV